MTAAGSFTRRRFIVTAGVAGVTVFASRRLFAQQNDEENGIVPTMVKAAAAASTALLASSTVPAGTVAKSSPVPDVVTSKVSDELAFTHSPLM